MQPTDPNKFTEKTWEALARTPDLVKQSQQQQIETEHLMKALLEQEGLTKNILSKAGISVGQFREKPDSFINRQPKITGTIANV